MTLPQTANHIVITEFGAPQVLQLRDMQMPRPGPGEVVVKVSAAGVNRADCMQRLGLYPPPPGASETLGLELSGYIAALGPEVSGWSEGDAVCALLAGGGYAEYCRVPATQLMPVPHGLDMVQAAAVPETAMTVWHNVFQRGALQPGEHFLVHGGSSGIGTTAIQLAKAFGADVITTAGSAEKCQACRDLGADVAINYKDDDFVEVVNAHTGGKGVDVVLDMVGGAYVNRNLSVMAEEGRHVTIAFMSGPKAEISMVPVMLKRLTLTGSTLRARPVAFKGTLAREVVTHVWPLIADGRFTPVIDTVLPLAAAAKAHAHMEASNHIGKIVLQA